jgi:hypothetical protein
MAVCSHSVFFLVRLNRMRRSPTGIFGVALGCLLFAAGCGGGAEDPFQRADVTGTVNVDGAPLKYGEIAFRGDEVTKNSEVAQATLMVRDGKFESNPAALPGLGKNTVLVIAYEGDAPPPPDPNDESGDSPPDPKVTGYYSTSLTVEEDKPVTIEIKKSELTHQPPQK